MSGVIFKETDRVTKQYLPSEGESDESWFVRHIFWCTDGRRCTTYYGPMFEHQADNLVLALS